VITTLDRQAPPPDANILRAYGLHPSRPRTQHTPPIIPEQRPGNGTLGLGASICVSEQYSSVVLCVSICLIHYLMLHTGARAIAFAVKEEKMLGLSQIKRRAVPVDIDVQIRDSDGSGEHYLIMSEDRFLPHMCYLLQPWQIA
jgi:hypothetical protein